MYDYRAAVISDILDYIAENRNVLPTDKEELIETLNEDLWAEDSVTGNASGSYYCNSAKARESLSGNEELVRDAAFDFGIDAKTFTDHFLDWEYWDVTVRCYLLAECIDRAVESL